MNNYSEKTISIAPLLLGILLSCVYFLIPVGPFSKVLFDAGLIIIVLCVWLFFWHSQHTPLRGYWLKPSNFFIMAFIAVNFQYLLDYRLGFKDDSSMHILYPQILNQCLVLGVVGLLAFTAGYVRWRADREPRVADSGLERAKNLISTLRTPIIVLHLLTFIAFVWTIDLDAFLSGESYSESTATYSHIEKLLGAMNVLVVLCSVVKTKSGESLKAYLSSFHWISLSIFGIYMVLRLISGDRGPFVYTSLLLFYGYAFNHRKKYRLLITLLVVVAAAFAMSVVGIARSLDLNQDFFSRVDRASSVFAASGRFADRSVSPLTEELGFSFVVNQTDVYAIEVEEEKLHPGSYLLISLLNGIPFIPSLITRIFHISYEDFSSTGFANVHFFGNMERTWSVGTTIIGDFFLQFSIFGVLIGLFLAGIIMKEVDMTIYVKERSQISIPLLVFALAYASKGLYLPRSLLFGELSTVILTLIVFLLLKVLFPRKMVL